LVREVALFGEDYAHQQVVGSLVLRIAHEAGLEVRCDWRVAAGGYGKVAQEFGTYVRDLQRQNQPFPDLVIVATDTNCKGRTERRRELAPSGDEWLPTVYALPDPHVERWLLLDGAAFKSVFGKGCQAPDQKCDRRRYKNRFLQGIRDTGMDPPLGGIEYAEILVNALDLERATAADRSLARFVRDVRTVLKGWR